MQNESKHAKSELKTFWLSPEAIYALENLAKRLSIDAKIKISMSKTVELAIFYIEDLSLSELIDN